MDTPITRAEHDEFVERIKESHKRLEDEDRRQNHRIDELEGTVRQISSLATSTEKLAVNMLKVQEQQGERLERLESRDGEMWRKVTGYAITAVISIVVGFVFAQIGM